MLIKVDINKISTCLLILLNMAALHAAISKIK